MRFSKLSKGLWYTNSLKQNKKTWKLGGQVFAMILKTWAGKICKKNVIWGIQFFKECNAVAVEQGLDQD